MAGRYTPGPSSSLLLIGQILFPSAPHKISAAAMCTRASSPLPHGRGSLQTAENTEPRGERAHDDDAAHGAGGGDRR